MNQGEAAPFPISLISTYFTRSVVIALPGYKPKDDGADALPINKLHVQEIEGKPRHFSVSMRSVINDEECEDYPYKIDVECHVQMVADETLTVDEAKRGIAITAHNVLYGAIREQVAWLTSRQPYGTQFLGLSVLRGATIKNGAKEPQTDAHPPSAP